jgi:hypothetical protein
MERHARDWPAVPRQREPLRRPRDVVCGGGVWGRGGWARAPVDLQWLGRPLSDQ